MGRPYAGNVLFLTPEDDKFHIQTLVLVLVLAVALVLINLFEQDYSTGEDAQLAFAY